MTPTALLARLTSRGYIPVSHGLTGYPEDWHELDDPAGSIRVVTHPGDRERPGSADSARGPAGRWSSKSACPAATPEAVTVAMLNAAEAWLAGRCGHDTGTRPAP